MFSCTAATLPNHQPRMVGDAIAADGSTACGARGNSLGVHAQAATKPDRHRRLALRADGDGRLEEHDGCGSEYVPIVIQKNSICQIPGRKSVLST